MRHSWIFGAALTLAACTQESATPAAESQHAAALVLSCDMLDLDRAALSARFGAENFTDQILDGPEGEQYTATILFPNDPARRAEIQWADEARASVAFFSVSGETSDWTGPHGVRLGASLAEIEQANGKPFNLYGFGWDYGGWSTHWNDGAFAGPDCLTRMRFQARGEGAQGDSEFSSESAEMRAADAYVREFLIRAAAAE